MSAIRLPLLCAFAGGCLCSAVMLYVWHVDTAAAIPAQKQLARSNELLAAAIAARNAEHEREVAADALRAPSRAAQAEPVASPELEAPPPAGSAVSDVLTDLETAYRRRIAAAAGAEAPAAAERAPESTSPATAQVEPAREAVAPAATPVAPAPVAPAPVAPAPVAPAPVAPAAIAAVALAPVVPAEVAPVAPPVAAAPALVAQMDSRPPDIHYGDVNNTYITNVRQGDVYVMQQQIAMMQYMQMLGMSSAAGHSGGPVGSTHFARGMTPQAQHYRQFPSTLTNPDNPWGLDFAPLNLVH